MPKKVEIKEPQENPLENLDSSPESPLDSSMRPWVMGGRPSEIPLTREAFADLIDRGDMYQILAEVPGIPKKQLNVIATKRSVEILGKIRTSSDEEGYVVRERGHYSKLFKKLSFPEEVKPEEATATLEDGLLDIRVPKKTPTPKTEKIERHRIIIT